MDMTVRAIPKMSIRTKAMRIDMGMVKEAIKAVLKSHMNKIMTATMSAAPWRMDICT
jgi:hypothetical protein